MGSAELDARRLAAAETRAQVVELRTQDGLTFEAIGERLGFSRQRAHVIFNAALAATYKPAVEAAVADHLAELAEARERVMEALRRQHVVVQQGHVVSEITGTDDDGHPIFGDALVDDAPLFDAARTLVALQAREAKLIGADAPTKTEAKIDGAVRYEVVGVDPADVA